MGAPGGRARTGIPGRCNCRGQKNIRWRPPAGSRREHPERLDASQGLRSGQRGYHGGEETTIYRTPVVQYVWVVTVDGPLEETLVYCTPNTCVFP